MWNVSKQINDSIETKSPTTGLLWSKSYKELLASHGYQLSVWNFPNLNKLGDMHGHKDKLLSIVLSPDGKRVASLGADETLRKNEIFKDYVFI